MEVVVAVVIIVEVVLVAVIIVVAAVAEVVIVGEVVVVVLHVGIVVVVVVSLDNITVDAETVVVVVVEIVVVVVAETVVAVVVEIVVVVVVETVVVVVVEAVVLLTHSSGQPKLVGSSANNSKQSVGHWFVFSVVVVEFGVSVVDVEEIVVRVVVDVEEVVVKGVVDVEVFVVKVVVSKQSAGHPSGCWHLHSQLLQISDSTNDLLCVHLDNEYLWQHSPWGRSWQSEEQRPWLAASLHSCHQRY